MAFRGTGGAKAPARRVERPRSSSRPKTASKAASRPVTAAWGSADTDDQQSLPEGYHARSQEDDARELVGTSIESSRDAPAEGLPSRPKSSSWDAPPEGLPSRPKSADQSFAGPSRPLTGPPARPSSGEAGFRQTTLKSDLQGAASLSQPLAQPLAQVPAPPPLSGDAGRSGTTDSAAPIPQTPASPAGRPRPRTGPATYGVDFRHVPLRSTADRWGTQQPPMAPGDLPAPPTLSSDILPIKARPHSAGQPFAKKQPTTDFKAMALGGPAQQGIAAQLPADASQVPPPPPALPEGEGAPKPISAGKASGPGQPLVNPTVRPKSGDARLTTDFKDLTLGGLDHRLQERAYAKGSISIAAQLPDAFKMPPPPPPKHSQDLNLSGSSSLAAALMANRTAKTKAQAQSISREQDPRSETAEPAASDTAKTQSHPSDASPAESQMPTTPESAARPKINITHQTPPGKEPPKPSDLQSIADQATPVPPWVPSLSETQQSLDHPAQPHASLSPMSQTQKGASAKQRKTTPTKKTSSVRKSGSSSSNISAGVWTPVLEVAGRSHLKPSDVRKVYDSFHEHRKFVSDPNPLLSKEDLATILKISPEASAPIYELLLHQGQVDVRALLVALTSLTRAKPADRIRFAALLLDDSGSGKLTMEQVTLLLRSSVLGNALDGSAPESQVIDEYAARLMNGANSISHEELVEAVQKDPILLLLLQQRGGKSLEDSNLSSLSETGPSFASTPGSTTKSSSPSPSKKASALKPHEEEGDSVEERASAGADGTSKADGPKLSTAPKVKRDSDGVYQFESGESPTATAKLDPAGLSSTAPLGASSGTVPMHPLPPPPSAEDLDPASPSASLGIAPDPRLPPAPLGPGPMRPLPPPPSAQDRNARPSASLGSAPDPRLPPAPLGTVPMRPLPPPLSAIDLTPASPSSTALLGASLGSAPIPADLSSTLPLGASLGSVPMRPVPAPPPERRVDQLERRVPPRPLVPPEVSEDQSHAHSIPAIPPPPLPQLYGQSQGGAIPAIPTTVPPLPPRVADEAAAPAFPEAPEAHSKARSAPIKFGMPPPPSLSQPPPTFELPPLPPFSREVDDSAIPQPPHPAAAPQSHAPQPLQPPQPSDLSEPTSPVSPTVAAPQPPQPQLPPLPPPPGPLPAHSGVEERPARPIIPRLDLSKVVNEFAPPSQPVPTKKPRQDRPTSGASSVSGASKHQKSGKAVKWEEDDLQVDFSERSNATGGAADTDLGDLELGDLQLGPRMSRKDREIEEEELIDDSLYAHNKRLLEERKARAIRCGPMADGQPRLVLVALVLLHVALLLFLWNVFEGRTRSHFGWVSKEVRLFLAVFCLILSVVTCIYCMAFKSLQDEPTKSKEYGELAKILKKQHAQAKALGEQKINPDALRLAQKMILHSGEGKSGKKSRWLHQ